MNPADIVESVRPSVDPMPLIERRMIRERLFGAGHGDVSRSISARSASGAVVSTAPRGMRAMAVPPSPRTGSLPKVVAGLLLFAALGALGWAFLSGNDSEEQTVTTSTLVPTSVAATTTAAPTTVASTERTGVNETFPLVLPREALAVDTVNIGAPAPGSSAALLRAPDGTTVWVAEVDGDPANTDGLTVQQVGAIGVGTASDIGEGDPASYQLQVPCGFVILNDAPGQALYRPAIQQLFQSMSIDALATIDISLPPGWSVVDIGTSLNSFTAQFQVPRFADTVPVILSQIPGGSLAQLTFGGRQLQATTFLGGDAFVDSQPLDPDLTSIYWRDADTVFNVRSEALDFAALEDFVASLEAVEASAWETRFDQIAPAAPALESSCTPQPAFGQTLDP